MLAAIKTSYGKTILARYVFVPDNQHACRLPTAPTRARQKGSRVEWLVKRKACQRTRSMFSISLTFRIPRNGKARTHTCTNEAERRFFSTEQKLAHKSYRTKKGTPMWNENRYLPSISSRSMASASTVQIQIQTDHTFRWHCQAFNQERRAVLMALSILKYRLRVGYLEGEWELLFSRW